jgi:uncharacterized protein
MKLSIAKVFMDTGALIALASNGDINHAKAKEIYSRLVQERSQLYTTNHVIDETCTWIARDRKLGHRAALELGRFIKDVALWVSADEAPLPALDGKGIYLIYSTPALEELAWNILAKHATSGFSFTDCTSFAAMRTFGIRTAFAYDAHFDIMGFTRI